MALDACSDSTCKHRLMTLLAYRKTRAETWDASFAIRVGKSAARLYITTYKKRPPRRPNGPGSIALFPCGIIERAYRDLRAQGIPLRKPLGPAARARLKKRLTEKRRAALTSGSEQKTDSDDMALV
jgi:hypothetical protein